MHVTQKELNQSKNSSKNHTDVQDIIKLFLRMYWTRSTNYVQGACGVKQAAIDWGYNEQDVINAFNEVCFSFCEFLKSIFQSYISRTLTKVQ